MTSQKNGFYRVVFEINVESDNVLNAAKTVQDWLRDESTNWQFYVQNDDNSEDIYSVDLEDNSLYRIDNFKSIID